MGIPAVRIPGPVRPRQAPQGGNKIEIALFDHVGAGIIELDRWTRTVTANDRARAVLHEHGNRNGRRLALPVK